jgi:hypothetical protein
MVCMQIATADACLVYWLKDKVGLTSTLTTFLRFEEIRKFVIGGADEEFLLQAYGVHLEGAIDLQHKVEKGLELDYTPGMEKLVHAFRPDIPYCKVSSTQSHLNIPLPSTHPHPPALPHRH